MHHEFVSHLISTAIMKTFIVTAFFACLGVVGASAESASLPRSTPEEQGIASAAILEFVKAADEQSVTANAIQSFMLVRHGR